MKQIILKGFAVLFILSMSWCKVALATTYYVSPTGSDLNTGTTASSPWRSLELSFKRIKNSDTIYILAGTYTFANKISIENKKKITIRGASPDSVELIYTGTSSDFAFVIGSHSDNVTIENLKINWRSDKNGNIIGIGGKNVTIRNCVLYFTPSVKRSKYDCIKIFYTASDILIEDCEIYGAPNQGIDAVGAKKITVRNNKIHDCQNAVVFKGGTIDCLIEGNRLYNFKYGAIGLGGTTGSFVKNPYDFEISNCIVRDNIIYYDYFHRNNIGGGIFLMGAVHCQVYNNTLYGPGIHIKRGGTVGKLQFTSRDNLIANNIIWRTGNDGLLLIEPGNSEDLVIKNNCFWATTGSGEFKINGRWIKFDEFRLSTLNQGAIWANPQFKDITQFDFSLKETSPCINKSMGVDALPDRDYIGAKVMVPDHVINPPNNIKVTLIQH